MNSQELRNLQEAYIDVYEGTHPDIEGQTEFASKVEAILASRKKRREQYIPYCVDKFKISFLTYHNVCS